MLNRYRVLMHIAGEILVEGEIDADELHDAIRAHAPAGLPDNPGLIIARAVLNGGSLAVEGWTLQVQRIPAIEG